MFEKCTFFKSDLHNIYISCILCIIFLFIINNHMHHILHILFDCSTATIESVPVHHRLWAPWIFSSLACHSSVLNTGQAGLRLSLVSVGETGTTPFKIWREYADLQGVKTKDGRDECNLNSWVLGWETKQWRQKKKKISPKDLSCLEYAEYGECT